MSEPPTPGDRTYWARQTSKTSPATERPARARSVSTGFASASQISRPGRSRAFQRSRISGAVSSAISTRPAPATARRTRSFAVRRAAPKGSLAPTAKAAPCSTRPNSISGAAAASAPISAAREWNSSSTNRSFNFRASGSERWRAAGSKGIGRSVGISTRERDRTAASLCCRRLSPIFPLISSALASSVSRSPYVEIHFFAVTCPTPGTPGMLSTLSPIKARTSRTWPGATPKKSWTPASSRKRSRPVWNTRIPGDTSCSMSLSAVTITTSNPCAAAFFDRVPMTSSAS